MVVTQTGSTCSCEEMAKPYKCKKCAKVFCFKCQVAFLVFPGFWETSRKIRCCPNCYFEELIDLRAGSPHPETAREYDRGAKIRLSAAE